MSRGTYLFDAPHFCGQTIHVEIAWSYDPGVRTFSNGDPGYPPSYDEEQTWWTDELREESIYLCPKCGIDLQDDTIFEATVRTLADKQAAIEEEQEREAEEEYEREYGPPDTWEQKQWEPDPDDLLPPGRAG
jgi:hypothetical protein